MKKKHWIIAGVIALIVFAPVDAMHLATGLITFVTTLLAGLHLH